MNLAASVQPTLCDEVGCFHFFESPVTLAHFVVVKNAALLCRGFILVACCANVGDVCVCVAIHASVVFPS